jgi:Na+/melibiose symporter-like transporter
MDYYFGMSEAEIREHKRPIFLKKWRKTEKSLERMAGVILIFAMGLLMAWERPGDQFTILAIAGFLAAAITLFVRSLRTAEQRMGLHFLSQAKHSQRSWMASAGAILLVIQGNRPLMWVGAGLLLAVGAWFRWRANQIEQFDRLFAKIEEEVDEEEPASEV